MNVHLRVQPFVGVLAPILLKSQQNILFKTPRPHRLFSEPTLAQKRFTHGCTCKLTIMYSYLSTPRKATNKYLLVWVVLIYKMIAFWLQSKWTCECIVHCARYHYIMGSQCICHVNTDGYWCCWISRKGNTLKGGTPLVIVKDQDVLSLYLVYSIITIK